MIIVEGHAATSHDGGIAIYQNGYITCLAAERIDHIKHSQDTDKAYKFLRDRIGWPENEADDFYRNRPDSEINHPLAHAASAYYPSPFDHALVVVVDGQGPYCANKVVSLSVWIGEGLNLREVESYPEDGNFCTNSIGHFYSALTYYLGFGFYEQGKTMGLSAYGMQSALGREMSHLCWFDGQTIRTDAEFIQTVFQEKYGKIFGREEPITHSAALKELVSRFGPMHEVGDPFRKSELNFAYAGEAALEDALVSLCKHLRSKYGASNLCMAGGVGLNISANSRIAEEAGFKSVFVQPAAGDDGQALGRLLYRMHTLFGLPRGPMANAYFGPLYTDSEIKRAAISLSSIASVTQYPDYRTLNRALASILADGGIAARCFGQSEIGPRALGNRSILADPRRKEMASALTALKHREQFQPFALSILREHTQQYFDISDESPYMLLSGRANQLAIERLPAGIHIDNRSRLQTVSRDQNAQYHDLLTAFLGVAGEPALLNTSFNDKGMPLVETPLDAAEAFKSMKGIEVLAMGNYLIRRDSVNESVPAPQLPQWRL